MKACEESNLELQEKIHQRDVFIQAIQIQEETLVQSKRDLNGNTKESVLRLFAAGEITAPEKEQFLDAVHLFQSIIVNYPESIERDKEHVKKLEAEIDKLLAK